MLLSVEVGIFGSGGRHMYGEESYYCLESMQAGDYGFMKSTTGEDTNPDSSEQIWIPPSATEGKVKK